MSSMLNEHQKVLLQILCQIDRICRKHDIKFVLFAGSAIGAARHKGFIPWDDDVDVAMLRPDYERFMQVAPKELDENIYYLQKEFSAHWPMFFSKLRLNHTACIERYIPKDPKVHQGVYIDIFPIDNLAENRIMRCAQFAASKIVIAKSLDRRGYLTDSTKKKLFMFLCRFLPLKPILRFAKRAKKNDSPMVHSFFAAASKYEKNIFPRKWFTEQVQMPFEEHSFPVLAHYHEMLTKIYGDYMQIPPEEERECKVHGVIVDLENSYECYIEEQKKMKITSYSKSIR